MSNPAKAATQDEGLDDADENLDNKGANTNQDDDESEDEILSTEEVKAFETAVSNAVKEMKRGKDGKYVLPKGLSPEVKHAAILEKRRRDTQSEFTKIAQAKKALEVENNALKKKAVGSVKIELTAEQAEELDDLKFSDPEAWRKKMNKYEREAHAKQEKELEEEIAKVSSDALAKDELERRKEVLIEFNREHPDFQLDDEVIQNDIPPRITKRLETGEISFEAFLNEVYEYTKTGKTVYQEKTRNQPNLSKVGGGSKPDKHAEKEDIILSYNKEVF
jgi:hypothetical protein